MDKSLHPTLYNGCDYLSMLGLKLNHVSKRGPTWRHKPGSTLALVLVSCLMAPSHYLIPCRFLIRMVLRHSPECDFTLPSYYPVHWVRKLYLYDYTHMLYTSHDIYDKSFRVQNNRVWSKQSHFPAFPRCTSNCTSNVLLIKIANISRRGGLWWHKRLEVLTVRNICI